MAEGHGDVKGQNTKSHTEANGGHGGFPPFDPSTFPSQLVSLVIIFVALYLIVSRIALPRVGAVIDARQNKIEGDLAAARSRAQAIGAETRGKLNAASEAERRQLDNKLAGRLADAEKTIAATRATAMGNVRGIAAEAASAIVERLTGKAPDSKAVATAVDASLKE